VPQDLKGKFTASLSYKTDPFEISTEETTFTIP
jgi:hypothetical protein